MRDSAITGSIRFQSLDQSRHHRPDRVFSLGSVEITIDLEFLVGSDAFLYGGFCQRMDCHFLAGADTRGIKHHGCGTVTDNNFPLVAESLDDGEHILIVRFPGILAELGHGVATTTSASYSSSCPLR